MNNDTHPEHVEKDLNPDPITGEPGSHPVGTGLGTAAGGAAAGAAAGAVAGPVGAVVGAVAGGVAGGLAGKAVAEKVDPTVEHAYWKDEYANRPYYSEDHDYDATYAHAHRHGWESRVAHSDKTFDEAEPALRRDWDDKLRDKAKLEWDQAKVATRDAWERIDNHPDHVNHRTAT